MRYQVKFREDALKEWQKLDKTIQQQFAKKGDAANLLI